MVNIQLLSSVFPGVIVQTLSGLGVWYLVLCNAIGVLAICFKVTETQMKKRRNIVLFSIFGATCWIVYFLLNGNLTSATINLIGCIQGLVFLQRGKHKWADGIFWLIFFIAVQIVIAFFTYTSWFSLFSIVAGVLSTFAYFVMNEKIYRYLLAILISLWIINGIVYFYWIALIHDVFALISIIIAIVRYNILGQKKKALDTAKQSKN